MHNHSNCSTRWEERQKTNVINLTNQLALKATHPPQCHTNSQRTKALVSLGRLKGYKYSRILFLSQARNIGKGM